MSNPLYYRTPSGLFIKPDDRRNVYPDPAMLQQLSRTPVFAQMFAYYSNTAFSDVATWARYRLNNNLYRYIRPIFNPITRVVDFYAEHIYPGALSTDSRLEDGSLSAVPFSFDTPTDLREAIGQIWQWSNWQNGNAVMVQNGAMTGVALVEVVDDVERGKIRYQNYFPSFVKSFVLDPYGNLDAYVIEFETSDPRVNSGQPFKYAKEVQRDFIAYYKNGNSYDYGDGEVVPNPYPFIPAVWVKHIDIGTDYGVPAIRSSMAKIDELNSIVSHTADHIHKQIESPRILWTDTTVTPLFGNTKVDYSDFDSRQQQVLLKGKSGGTTDTLVGTLDPQTIVPIVEKLLDEIEKDYPEITMYEKLRDQNIVTAPGASRLMGDVARKVARPASNYDLANIKLNQMGTAIGGWRANSGAWGSNLTPQQEKFLPFDFLSYTKGQLDHKITPRPLTSPTSTEEATEFQVRATAVQAVGDALPLEEKLRKLGYREDQIPAVAAKARAEQLEKQKTAMEMAQAKSPAVPAKEDTGNVGK